MQFDGKKWIIIGILYAIEIALLVFTSGDSSVLAILALVCAIIGWRAVTMIQPSMFVWMPLMGWLIYFLIKFIISYLVGIFIAPYVVGKKIVEMLNSDV